MEKEKWFATFQSLFTAVLLIARTAAVLGIALWRTTLAAHISPRVRLRRSESHRKPNPYRQSNLASTNRFNVRDSGSLAADTMTVPFQVPFILVTLFSSACARQKGEWEPCREINGTCFDTFKYNCSVPAVAGKCRGPRRVQCCQSNGGLIRANCDGVCKLITTSCATKFVRLKCPGPNQIQCCLNETIKPEEVDMSIWIWLGPVLGAVATILAAFIGVFCVRRNRQSNQQADASNIEE